MFFIIALILSWWDALHDFLRNLHRRHQFNRVFGFLPGEHGWERELQYEAVFLTLQGFADIARQAFEEEEKFLRNGGIAVEVKQRVPELRRIKHKVAKDKKLFWDALALAKNFEFYVFNRIENYYTPKTPKLLNMVG